MGKGARPRPTGAGLHRALPVARVADVDGSGAVGRGSIAGQLRVCAAPLFAWELGGARGKGVGTKRYAPAGAVVSLQRPQNGGLSGEGSEIPI